MVEVSNHMDYLRQIEALFTKMGKHKGKRDMGEREEVGGKYQQLNLRREVRDTCAISK